MGGGHRIVAVLPLLLLTGCASLISGRYQRVSFESTPPGATVRVDGEPPITTPGNLILLRKTAHTADITLEGYQSERVTIEREISTGLAANVLVLDLGVPVDFLIGGAYELDPSRVNVALRPAP